jgi:hypothetical protein
MIRKLWLLLILMGWSMCNIDAQIQFNRNYTSGLGSFWVHEVNGYYYSAIYKDQPQQSLGADYFFGKFTLQGDLVDSLILSAPDTNLNPSFFSLLDDFTVMTTATRYFYDSSVQGLLRRQLMLISFNPLAMDTNWIRFYGDTSIFYHDHLIFKSTRSPHYFLVGAERPWQNFGINPKIHLMKVDTLGTIVWQKSYASSKFHFCSGLSEKANGDIILACAREEQAQFFDSLVQFTWLLDSLGNIKQEKLHMETAPQYFGALFTERTVPGKPTDYIMANQIDTTYNQQGYHYRYVAVWGLDSNLNQTWRYHLDTTKFYTESGPWILKSFPDGQYMLAGLSFLPTNFYIWAALFSAENELLWSHNYYHRIDGDHYPFDVIRTSDGGYLFSGVTNSTGPQNTQDAWLVKVDSNGCLDPLNCSPLSAPDWTMDEKPILAYPNPAGSEIYFEQQSLADKIWTVTCISGTGATIFTKAIPAQAGRIRLDVSDLPSGLYLFRVNGTHLKVMKE